MSVIDHESFAQALMVYAREEVERDQSLRSHPSPERLAAYHADELSEAEDLEIQRHLAICSQCPALLIDLEELFEPRQRDLGLSDSWVSSAWEDLRSRLGGKKGPGEPRPQVKTPWWAWFSAALRPAVLATGLAVVCLGLGTGMVYLNWTQDAPELNPGKVVLRAADAIRGPKPKPPLTRIVFEPGRETMLVEIPLSLNADRYDRFDLRMGSKPMGELVRQRDGVLRMTLKRNFFDPGQYDVEVTLPADEQRVVEEFFVEIVYL